jgi:BlaI family penicillinase repressor
VTLRNKSKRPLTELQQAILESIWKQGPQTADQVREGLLPNRDLKDSTVRTLLRRLEGQGYLRHRLHGKTYVYEASESPASAAARTVRHLIDRFWAGSAEQFLVGMVDEKVLSAEQLKSLARKVRTIK